MEELVDRRDIILSVLTGLLEDSLILQTRQDNRTRHLN